MSITLKQLSELSGLSIRTVSRVLKNEAHVQAEKREQVLFLAKKYHYIPNMAARNLRLNRSKFVGILCSNLTNEIFLHKLTDLELRLEAHGYYPIVCCYDAFKGSVEKLFAECAGLVDFFIVTLFDCEINNPGLPELFARYPLTPIYVDPDFTVESGHQLEINRATGIAEAISYLVAHDKRQILHCGNVHSREIGLQLALTAMPAERRPELRKMPGDSTFEAGRRQAPKILASGADAVFFDTDRQALGFLNYATEHHIAIPEQLGIIGFDDDAGSKLVYPALSTVAHPVEELNQAIVEIIETKPEQPVHQSFATRFILRQSC